MEEEITKNERRVSKPTKTISDADLRVLSALRGVTIPGGRIVDMSALDPEEVYTSLVKLGHLGMIGVVKATDRRTTLYKLSRGSQRSFSRGFFSACGRRFRAWLLRFGRR